MENTTDNQKPKRPGRKGFLIGFTIASVIAIGLACWNVYDNNLKAEEYRKNQAARESIRLDSIAKANKEIRKYWGMVKFIKRQDSVYASLKYRVGDIVFLKPDSLRGVVQNVMGDDQMDCFTYFILCKNKDNQYEVLERNVKLIY